LRYPRWNDRYALRRGNPSHAFGVFRSVKRPAPNGSRGEAPTARLVAQVPVLVPAVRRLFALLLAVALAATSACARALHEPPPLTAINPATRPAAGPGAASSAAAPAALAGDVDGLLRDGAAAFARRPDAGAVSGSLDLYLRAARADDIRVEGLLGAAAASAWLIEHEADPSRRERLATGAVEICQWCVRRAPERIECTYRLALAIGQQARERSSTALDGLKRMMPLLEQVTARAPTLDAAGGHRVMALVLLRAPGWPTGPGDPDAALEHARKADALVPDDPQNLLALAEAMAATGQPEDARKLYARAEATARAAAAAGNPDASEWADTAARALRSLKR
jgi:tetratricopeptide (TPR) repeat protein